MSAFGEVSVGRRIERLRGDFDRSFAEPARSHDVEHVELLVVGAGGRPYALRLSQTAGLHPDRPVTPLPSPLPALLGLAGFAGTVVPVYDLAALLGHPAAARPRWLVLAAGSPPLALAFHELEGHVRVPADAIISETAGDRRGFLRGLVRLAGGTRPIVDVPAARAAVHALTGHDQPGPDQPGQGQPGQGQPGQGQPGQGQPGQGQPGQDPPGQDQPGQDPPGPDRTRNDRAAEQENPR